MWLSLVALALTVWAPRWPCAAWEGVGDDELRGALIATSPTSSAAPFDDPHRRRRRSTRKSSSERAPRHRGHDPARGAPPSHLVRTCWTWPAPEPEHQGAGVLVRPSARPHPQPGHDLRVVDPQQGLRGDAGARRSGLRPALGPRCRLAGALEPHRQRHQILGGRPAHRHRPPPERRVRDHRSEGPRHRHEPRTCRKSSIHTSGAVFRPITRRGAGSV